MKSMRIRVEHLGKRYRIGERNNYRTLRDVIVTSLQRRRLSAPQHIWALRDVSFDVAEGEVVGFIGPNGAGKSTLLKLLSRVTDPTEGSFQLRGRVESLLDIGVGFHPELTGRENVFLSGAILGMKKREIDRRFNEIVEFSELRKFIDTPIKYYSTGMWVRLGFAVAAHLESEILLVDEVLAAGDAAFQRKCLGKMDEAIGTGRTVVMISHNLKAIADLCGRCLWIDHGGIVQRGPPRQVIESYLASNQPKRTEGIIVEEMHDHPTGEVLFRHVAILNSEKKMVNVVPFGDQLRIMVEFEVIKQVSGMRIAAALERQGDGYVVAAIHNTDAPGTALLNLKPGTYSTSIETKLPLIPGWYSVNLEAKPDPGFWGSGKNWDLVRRAIDFNVRESTRSEEAAIPAVGVVRPKSKWTLVRKHPA
jgi:lipopolysaccharide transport system ATP-binding protein